MADDNAATPESQITDTGKLPPRPPVGKVRLELVRAYWSEDDQRINEGTIFDCDAAAAVRLVEKGIAKSAD